MSGPWGKVPWLHNIGDILLKVAKQFYSDPYIHFFLVYIHLKTFQVYFLVRKPDILHNE